MKKMSKKYRLEFGDDDPLYFDNKDEFISWCISYLSGDSSNPIKFFYPDGSYYGDNS